MGHEFLRYLCPWACLLELSKSQEFFPALLKNPLPSSGSCKVSWSNPFLLPGLLESPFLRGLGQTSFAFFSFFSKAQGLPIYGLGLSFTHYKWALAHGLGLPYFLRVHLLWLLILVTFWTSTNSNRSYHSIWKIKRDNNMIIQENQWNQQFQDKKLGKI